MRDIQWSFISLATASLSHLLLRVVLGRELGPDGLGIYTLVFTIYMFGMQFAAFGIGAALTKYVAEFSDDLKKTGEYISSGIIGSIVTGILIGVILFTLSGIISINVFNIPEMRYLLEITALCFPFIAIQKTVIGSLNGFRKMKQFAFMNIALNSSILLVSIFMVMYLKMNVIGAVLGFALPTILIGFLSIIFVRSYLMFPNISFLKNDILRDVLHFGFYVVLGNSIGYIYTHIDNVMIGYYLNETEVGYYAISAIFIQGITLIPSAVQRVTSPIIAKSYAKKEYNSILRLLKSVTLKVFLVSLLLSLFLAIFGRTLIITIFEDVFLSAYLPMLILLIGYTVYSSFMSIGTFYASIGHVRLSYKIALFSAILSIALNAFFIPKYGIIGAAVATSASLILLTSLHYVIIKHLLKNYNLEL
ncbi:flippase [uncultured Methanolobus sp.]|uniref:flippase n=1 Tax=uncultured Methanolobus sp. TaxID=218300 RepID=UPI002AAB415C|nr:flippase [uncultured Methanolobus sp.]